MSKNILDFLTQMNNIPSMNNAIQTTLASLGMSVAKASRMTGIPYITISQHLRGIRTISPELAIKYESLLGIPRSDLRPDLWPPPPKPLSPTKEPEGIDNEA